MKRDFEKWYWAAYPNENDNAHMIAQAAWEACEEFLSEKRGSIPHEDDYEKTPSGYDKVSMDFCKCEHSKRIHERYGQCAMPGCDCYVFEYQCTRHSYVKHHGP